MAWKMENLRLRLEFKNGDILSDAQKSEGLEKSWVLVPQPQINFSTVAALSAHIMQKFHLKQSCSHGILLSMDGFALPPFVSISILKDKDVISVQKIGHLTIEGSDTTGKVKGQKIISTDCVSTGTLLLANEEFNKESRGYESEVSDDESSEEHHENNLEANNDHLEDGNEIFKKRKASQKLQGSKKKKQRSEPRENFATENFQESEYIEIPYENEVPLGKKGKTKKKKSSKNENQTTCGANDKHDEKTKKDVESFSNFKINEEFQENGEDVDGATNEPGSTKKGPSRSAQRQYAKRIMLKEMKKVLGNNAVSPSKKAKHLKKRQGKAEKRAGPDQLQNEGLDQPKGLLHWKKFGGKDVSKACSKPDEENQNHKTHGNSNKYIDTEKEIVPIEIRPGHIRFEAFKEDADQEVQQVQVQQIQVSTETFQWNGITSKKQGQKWGTVKGSTSRRNDYEAKEAKLENNRASEWMDFAKLPPLLGMPKEGDVIAYRLLELSSSWTPEISSYRVGKVSTYNSQSRKILLMSVPEYPIVSKKLEEEEAATEQDYSIYSKDGTLEIDFTSLVDVRTVKSNDLEPSASKGIAKHADGGPLCIENIITSMSLGSTEKCTDSMVKGNGSPNQGNAAQAPSTPVQKGVDPWEQLSGALDSKKEGLSKESRWGKMPRDSKKEELPKESGWGKITTSNTNWSYTSHSNNRSYNSNRNNGSYGGFRGRGRGSTVRPTISYRGRGRTYGRNWGA